MVQASKQSKARELITKMRGLLFPTCHTLPRTWATYTAFALIGFMIVCITDYMSLLGLIEEGIAILIMTFLAAAVLLPAIQKHKLLFAGTAVMMVAYSYIPVIIAFGVCYRILQMRARLRLRCAYMGLFLPALTLVTVFMPDTAGFVFLLFGIPGMIIGPILGYFLGTALEKISKGTVHVSTTERIPTEEPPPMNQL